MRLFIRTALVALVALTAASGWAQDRGRGKGRDEDENRSRGNQGQRGNQSQGQRNNQPQGQPNNPPQIQRGNPPQVQRGNQPQQSQRSGQGAQTPQGPATRFAQPQGQRGNATQQNQSIQTPNRGNNPNQGARGANSGNAGTVNPNNNPGRQTVNRPTLPNNTQQLPGQVPANRANAGRSGNTGIVPPNLGNVPGNQDRGRSGGAGSISDNVAQQRGRGNPSDDNNRGNNRGNNNRGSNNRGGDSNRGSDSARSGSGPTIPGSGQTPGGGRGVARGENPPGTVIPPLPGDTNRGGRGSDNANRGGRGDANRGGDNANRSGRDSLNRGGDNANRSGRDSLNRGGRGNNQSDIVNRGNNRGNDFNRGNDNRFNVNRPNYDWNRNNFQRNNNFVNVTPRNNFNHGDWHHGDWNSRWWGPSWGYRPWGWGGGWGVGPGWVNVGAVALAAPWTWGYYNYSNPYYVQTVAVPVPYYVDYSQPIVVQAASAPPQQIIDNVPDQPSVEEQAAQHFATAQELFQRGSYQQSLAAVDKAIALLPSDALLHEFRALNLYALGDYQNAAATLYAVLSMGPGWDWDTMSGLYPDIAVYTNQLRNLENYRKEHPDAADARFTLAYHYLVAGHEDAAANELAKVVDLQPNDKLSAQLLKGLRGEAPQVVAAPQAAAPPSPDMLVGDWKATGPDGSAFRLQLGGNRDFTWTVNNGGNPNSITGNYTLENDHLVLKASDQNSLAGQVAVLGPNEFNFRLAGDNPADPGLNFKK